MAFTWYDNIELNIPNTTNAIDGHFADLKNKLRNHIQKVGVKNSLNFVHYTQIYNFFHTNKTFTYFFIPDLTFF